MSVGLLFRLYAFYNSLNWVVCVYTSVIGNIDLFFGGMLLAFIEKSNMHFLEYCKKFNILLIITCIIFCALIIFSCYIWYSMLLQQEWANIWGRFYSPTLYLLTITLCIIVINRNFYYNGFLGRRIVLIINEFSTIAFEFYLFHSWILDRIYNLLLNGHNNGMFTHIWIVSIIAVITFIVSKCFHKICN